ncbi:MAG TPA: MlaC/ttg2D family ABC transporter substrate-binding protein [Candidatus Brocadiia bacterium]|nr:ABC transporter substrate-binding protein [Candidatus Brocadiales bacterium]
MRCKRIMFVIFAGIFLLMSKPVFLWAEEPGRLIMGTIEKSLSIRKEVSVDGKVDKQMCEIRLWEEIAPLFNLEESSKRALGQHWRNLTHEEKKEFVELFTDIIKEAYLGQACTSTGEKFVYLSEKQDDKYAKVLTKFITNTGTEISVDFRLLNNQGKWSIYDVVIEGVSLVNNYRSQFNSILVKSSYEELIQMIKEKKSK